LRLAGLLREPAIIVALIGLPVSVATLIAGDLIESRNAAMERAYQQERDRCGRAFAIAQDETLNERFAGDEAFVAEQVEIARSCGGGR